MTVLLRSGGAYFHLYYVDTVARSTKYFWILRLKNILILSLEGAVDDKPELSDYRFSVLLATCCSSSYLSDVTAQYISLSGQRQ